MTAQSWLVSIPIPIAIAVNLLIVVCLSNIILREVREVARIPGCCCQKLALDRLQDNYARSQIPDVVISLNLGRHIDSPPVNWPGWASIDPATLCLVAANAKPGREAAE